MGECAATAVIKARRGRSPEKWETGVGVMCVADLPSVSRVAVRLGCSADDQPLQPFTTCEVLTVDRHLVALLILSRLVSGGRGRGKTTYLCRVQFAAIYSKFKLNPENSGTR